LRPRIVGEALQKIAADPEILSSLFEVLEMQNIVEGEARVTFVPQKSELLSQLLVAEAPQRAGGPPLLKK
jgi:hypothetical protein